MRQKTHLTEILRCQSFYVSRKNAEYGERGREGEREREGGGRRECVVGRDEIKFACDAAVLLSSAFSTTRPFWKALAASRQCCLSVCAVVETTGKEGGRRKEKEEEAKKERIEII